MLANELSEGNHEFDLRVSKATTSQGHAVRIIQFGATDIRCLTAGVVTPRSAHDRDSISVSHAPR